MKNFLKLLFLFFIFFLFSKEVLAQEQINDFKTNIVINKEGTIDVEERIIYDFGSSERHGIFREIPFTTKNKEGKKFKLEIINYSLTDNNGNKYRYDKSVENENVRLKIGDPDRTITGVHTYIVKYRVAGALTYFSDHDELYWNATGNNWTVPINSYTSQVYLPVGISQAELKVICYTGSDGSTEQNCSYKKADNFVSIVGTKPLNSYEGLTFAVSFPKGHVEVVEPKPYLTFWETIWGKITLGLIIVAAILWYIIYPLWIPIKWLRQGRDPSAGSGQVQKPVSAWFDPPKTATGRSLTPEESGALLDERVDMSDISAMIVSLAQRGFIKIEERKKNEFYLIKRTDFLSSEELIPLEITFLRSIFTSSDEYELKKNKLYNTVEKAKTEIYERLVSDGFFAENPNKIRSFYMGIGALALTTFNLGLAFSAFFFGTHMPKKTSSGVHTANLAKSLRNFLASQERQLKFQADKQLMFEKLLPYAVAFGVEKIWAERFKDFQLKEPEWYSSYGTSGRFTSTHFTRSLNSSFASVRSAATPVSSSTGHGSGFSGGSSGGGGGGGGGGSW